MLRASSSLPPPPLLCFIILPRPSLGGMLLRQRGSSRLAPLFQTANCQLRRHLHALYALSCVACSGRSEARPSCVRANANRRRGPCVFVPFGHLERMCVNVARLRAGFHMAARIGGRTSGEVVAEFAKILAARYGWSYLAIIDQGPEFTDSAFQAMLGECGVIGHIIDAWDPLQAGRTERASQAVKQILEEVIEGPRILATEEFDMALSAAVELRNRCMNRLGFSAHQRVGVRQLPEAARVAHERRPDRPGADRDGPRRKIRAEQRGAPGGAARAVRAGRDQGSGLGGKGVATHAAQGDPLRRRRGRRAAG